MVVNIHRFMDSWAVIASHLIHKYKARKRFSAYIGSLSPALFPSLMSHLYVSVWKLPFRLLQDPRGSLQAVLLVEIGQKDLIPVGFPLIRGYRLIPGANGLGQSAGNMRFFRNGRHRFKVGANGEQNRSRPRQATDSLSFGAEVDFVHCQAFAICRGPGCQKSTPLTDACAGEVWRGYEHATSFPP